MSYAVLPFEKDVVSEFLERDNQYNLRCDVLAPKVEVYIQVIS
jgi:hypothetical protein